LKIYVCIAIGSCQAALLAPISAGSHADVAVQHSLEPGIGIWFAWCLATRKIPSIIMHD
jgi:hypothetical protein